MQGAATSLDRWAVVRATVRLRILAIGVLVAGTTCLAADAQERPRRRDGGAIRFSSDLQSTLAAARASGRPVVLSFHAVWCPNCRRMAELTISAPEVQALADAFLWVSIDIDRNVSLAREYDVYATPHVYLLDSAGARRGRIVGSREPAEFAGLLTSFLSALQGEDEFVVHEEDAPATELRWTPEGYRGLAICFSHVGSPTGFEPQGGT